ncbi:MAG TPA: M23 family metallopeptidase [Myxococcota bacterium]|nr:M23 family metallopeptidase [Myxococcota bacterium]
MGHVLALVALLAYPTPRALEISVTPPKPRQGQLVLIELAGVHPGDRVEGTFDERRLRFFVDQTGRIRALSSVPLGRKPGNVSLLIQLTPGNDDPVIRGQAVEVMAGEFEKQGLSVDPRFVKAPLEARGRIGRERRAMKRLWKPAPTPRKWRGSFGLQPGDKICSTFGLRRVFNGKLRSRHWGLDIDGKLGRPVRAIGAGRVVMVADRYFSGGTLVIDHGLRLFSLYFHLSAFEVKKGQLVDKGQLVGRVGKSGRVTGPHLHLSTKLEGVTFDPASLLDADLSEGGGRQP